MPDERTWIPALRSGDKAAFREIFLHYTPSLRRFARLSVPRDIAEDIVQDVLFTLWQRREVVAIGEGELAPYLFGAVRNKTWQYLRHERIAERESSAIELALRDAREAHEPDATIIETDLRAALAVAMQQLSETQRAILVLRWNEGMSYDQIADIMAISPAAAAQHVSRARKVIQPVLEKFR